MRMTRTVPPWLAGATLVLLATASADAATGRLRGEVVDEAGDPIPGVSVTVSSADLPSFREQLETNKNGVFTLTVAQISPVYTLQLAKPGYRSLKADVRIRASEIGRETYTLPAVADTEASAGDPAPAPSEVASPAVQAFNEGLTAQRAGDLATARTRFETALAEDETLAPAHVALATVYLDLGEHELALSSANHGLELAAGDREALRVRYEALRGMGRRQEAQEALAALTEAEGASEAATRIYNEGSEAYQAEDLDTALAKFQQAAEADPTLFDAHHAAATILLHRGELTAAAEAADRALGLNPEDPRALRVAYDAYNGLGDGERATTIAGRLAAVDPESSGAGLVESAGQLFTAGDVAAARTLLEQALAIDPDLSKAHYLLGLCHISAGNTDEAKRHLSRFVELDPEAADAAIAREMVGMLD